MKTEATVLFHSYKGVSLVAVCQREKRKNMREVWIYPNGSPMDQSFANELLHDLRTIDDDEGLESVNRTSPSFLEGPETNVERPVPSPFLRSVVTWIESCADPGRARG